MFNKHFDSKTEKSKSILRSKALKLGSVASLIACAPLMMGVYSWEPNATAQSATKNLATLDAKVIAEITKQSLSYTSNIQKNTAMINEAIRLAVSQEALAAQQIATQDRKAKQVNVAALQGQKIAQDLLDVTLDYGGKTGQGYNVCQVYSENKQLDKAVSTAQNKAEIKVLTTDNAPGVMTSNSATALKNRREIHNDNFCTPEEAEQNICEASPVAGADSNASVLFTSAKPGTKIGAAKASVRQNILGNPTLAVPSEVGGSIAAQAYLHNVNRKTALSAFPAYSLAYLESMSEVRDDLKDKKGNPQSPNDVLFNTVTRYYGGPDSKEWVKSMIAQQPRGLLVELAKMEGLGAWMDYQEYLANQRMEGNLAAMTITTALPMEDTLARQDSSLKQDVTRSRLSP